MRPEHVDRSAASVDPSELPANRPAEMVTLDGGTSSYLTDGSLNELISAIEASAEKKEPGQKPGGSPRGPDADVEPGGQPRGGPDADIEPGGSPRGPDADDTDIEPGGSPRGGR